jgi:lipopolysaccharide export system ATP-binding protein
VPASLLAEGLCKAYRRRPVVREVSFAVHPGEIVGLLGANGAGKTTCFHMTAGLVPLDAGRVRLGDVDLGRLPLHRRARLGLGYLPQEPTVFRGLTAHANLLAILELYEANAAVCRRRADALLDDYNLQHARNTLGSDLSGGERRRLEMARALINSPQVLLLDEPFAGVDPIAVGEIKGFMRQVRDRGIGILLTDHNVRETLGICSRAYLMHEGGILFSGTPQELVAHPAARSAYLGENFQIDAAAL